MILQVMRCEYCKKELHDDEHTQALAMKALTEDGRSYEDFVYWLHFCIGSCRVLWREQHSSRHME